MPDRPRTAPRSLWHLAARFWPLPLLALILGLTAAPHVGNVSTKADLLGQFLLQAAVGTTAAILLFIALRQRLAAALSAVALALQLGVLQPSFFPARAGGEQGETVEVLFANVWWRNQRLPDLAAAITALDADIVVLVEIEARTLSILAELAPAYPYRADCLSHWTCDSVVLSKLPIIEDLSSRRTDRRIAMSAALIETGFGPITVAGAHLDQPLPPGRLRQQERQVEGLIELLAPIDAPLLLVGDFNSAPWGRLLRGFAEGTGLEIAWGLEGTWPAFLPWPLRIPIDHAFTGRGLELVDRTVIRLPGSDHRSLHLRVGPARGV